MASSNRHWPSMFKSKPCNQPWHDINTPLLATTCLKSHLSSGCEEKTPEPKPRWNPKPEQIRILESIFNSGMVNPPREEIHRIRLQLQQYGQVGDANVFYWFQNRKSRTKNKHRQQSSTRTNYRPSITNINTTSNTSIANANIDALNNGINVGALNNNTNSVAFPSATMAVSTTMTTPTSSSSSSSERSSGSSKPLKPTHAAINLLDPVNQIYNNFHGSVELSGSSEPSLLFQNPHTYCFSIPELTSLIAAPEHLTGEGLGLWTEPMSSSGVASEEEGIKFKTDSELHYGLGLWSDLINQAEPKGLVEGQNGEDKARIGLLHDCSFGLTSANVASTVVESVITASVPAASRVANVSRRQNMVTSSPHSEIQGFGNEVVMGDLARLTVFINNVAYDMPAARMNVKSVFGPNAVLVHASSGYPVPIDELANTLQPLQHGAAYYVVS